jgi:ribosomal-protein-alanine N-acetyltransferase
MALLRTATPSDFGPVIEAEKVVLRTPQMSDYPAWAELRAAIREDVGYALFIFAAMSGSLVGGLTLCNVRRGVTQSCTLGYWIGAKYAHQGYMTAAVRAVIPFVFDSLELHRLEAACLPSNRASIKLLERTGFKREGTICFTRCSTAIHARKSRDRSARRETGEEWRS